MIDRRLIPDLRYLAAHFAISINEGYAGPLPGNPRKIVGCPRCHVADSDHKNGMAVDIGPRTPSARCDRHWKGVTRLAEWAEPRQNHPRAPFRWVGYDGDAGHGCGNHLHLSWTHADAPHFRVVAWVEVFKAGDRALREAAGARPEAPARAASTSRHGRRGAGSAPATEPQRPVLSRAGAPFVLVSSSWHRGSLRRS